MIYAISDNPIDCIEITVGNKRYIKLFNLWYLLQENRNQETTLLRLNGEDMEMLNVIMDLYRKLERSALK